MEGPPFRGFNDPRIKTITCQQEPQCARRSGGFGPPAARGSASGEQAARDGDCSGGGSAWDYAGAEATALLSVGIRKAKDIAVNFTIHLPVLHGSIEKGGEKPIVTFNAGIFPASSSAEGMTPFYASRSLLGAPGTMGDSRTQYAGEMQGALRMRHCSLSPRWVLQRSQQPPFAL